MVKQFPLSAAILLFLALLLDQTSTYNLSSSMNPLKSQQRRAFLTTSLLLPIVGTPAIADELVNPRATQTTTLTPTPDQQELPKAEEEIDAPAPAPAAAPKSYSDADLTSTLLLLRGQEAVSQELNLLKSGKYKNLQRANVKLAVRFIITNYALTTNFAKVSEEHGGLY